MSVVFAFEPTEAVIHEIAAIVARDGGKMPNTLSMPLEPEYPRFIAAVKAGLLNVYTARVDGALVGYGLWMVGTSLHYNQRRWAMSDTVWLDPENRGARVSTRLLEFAENHLREAGVCVMQTAAKVNSPWSRILDAADHILTDVVHTKGLRDG